jgi:hypothetical protein
MVEVIDDTTCPDDLTEPDAAVPDVAVPADDATTPVCPDVPDDSTEPDATVPDSNV